MALPNSETAMTEAAEALDMHDIITYSAATGQSKTTKFPVIVSKRGPNVVRVSSPSRLAANATRQYWQIVVSN